MDKTQSLLVQAAEIRDASTEAENTALRVGSLLVTLIQELDAELPVAYIKGDTVYYSTTKDGFKLEYTSVAADRSEAKHFVTIPVADSNTCGLMSVGHVQTVAALDAWHTRIMGGRVWNNVSVLPGETELFISPTLFYLANGSVATGPKVSIPAASAEHAGVMTAAHARSLADATLRIGGIAVFPFDTLAYHRQEAEAHPVGTVAYCAEERKFVTVTESGVISYGEYNTAPGGVARQDCLYRSGGDLYTGGMVRFATLSDIDSLTSRVNRAVSDAALAVEAVPKIGKVNVNLWLGDRYGDTVFTLESAVYALMADDGFRQLIGTTVPAGLEITFLSSRSDTRPGGEWATYRYVGPRAVDWVQIVGSQQIEVDVDVVPIPDAEIDALFEDFHKVHE